MRHAIPGLSLAVILIGRAVSANAALAAGRTDPSPPLAVQQAVCRPTVTIDGQPKRTGTAFLVQTSEPKPRLVLVMAHHLFSLTGHRRMSWSEMPARALSATCRTLDAKTVWTAGAAFAIEGAHPLGDLDSLRDIAILPVAEEGATLPPPLKLASQAPVAGDTVWLLAQTANQATVQTRDQDRPGAFFHRGHVVRDGGFLAFVYDDRTLKLGETSGAPIVDVHGDVVGVNVGYISRPDSLIGVADTLATIQAALLDAASPP